MRLVRALVATSILTAGIASSLDAHAQASGQDAATAQALFDDGKRLMQLGKHGEACPKLLESERLDPGAGTRLAIALCHEGEGRTATAWAEFNVVLTDARRDRRPDRETAATEHIRALEKKLTRLTISVERKDDGLEIRRDGALVGEAQWSTPLPIDPGKHRFEARAPGHKTWESEVTISGEGSVVDVKVPSLELAASAPPVVAPVQAAPPAPVQTAPVAPTDEKSSSRGAYMTWAAIAGGVGVVATGVGVAFGVSASTQWKSVHRACPNNACTSSGDIARGSDAGRAADMSTVFLLVGGAGIATAAVLFFAAPSNDSKTGKVRVTPLVGYGTAGLALGGAL
ncbi:MAG: hypothetical protein JWM74_3993 [Myxococcaceae bacterium]|nr:hypothetical protein [Myxococcaceae bacterium]